MHGLEIDYVRREPIVHLAQNDAAPNSRPGSDHRLDVVAHGRTVGSPATVLVQPFPNHHSGSQQHYFFCLLLFSSLFPESLRNPGTSGSLFVGSTSDRSHLPPFKLCNVTPTGWRAGWLLARSFGPVPNCLLLNSFFLPPAVGAASIWGACPVKNKTKHTDSSLSGAVSRKEA